MLKDAIFYGSMFITLFFIISNYAFNKQCFDSLQVVCTTSLLLESILIEKIF